MKSESGVGRTRNLLTPWAHRKSNIATVTFKSQFVRPTVSTANEGKLWTWFNLLQHVSKLREAPSVSLESAQRSYGCVAPVLTCVGSQTWGKKKVLHCELLCSFFFLDTSVTADQTVRKSGLTASTRGTITSAAPMCSHFVAVGVSLWLPAHELFSENIKTAKRSDRARK